MNILIVKLSAIGDVVHTLPALAALRKLYPQAFITWVIEEGAADLIQNHPYLDKVLVSHRKRWLRDLKNGRLSTAGEIIQFIKELRSRRYDLVIDFHGLLKSSLIVLLTSAERKIGYDSMQELSGLFIREKVPEDMDKHAVDRYLDLVRYLDKKEHVTPGAGSCKAPATAGDCQEKVEFAIPVFEAQEQRITQLLASNGLADRFVALNPVALWQTKLWDDAGFARLCDRIVTELKLPVVFTGTRKQEISPIQALMSVPSVNLAGETSLRELACLYRHAAFVITTDSGPMHIAAAVGTPVVALIGPTDARRTGPYGKGHRVVSVDIPCRPCFRKKCSTRECMHGITADAVFDAVSAILVS
jgi:3-deoxy-D-manno-octulosonic-acid transferase/heptosyltransferase-1